MSIMTLLMTVEDMDVLYVARIKMDCKLDSTRIMSLRDTEDAALASKRLHPDSVNGTVYVFSE